MRVLPVEHEADVGLYIHFPYCVQKCPYCDFNSYPQQKRGERYPEYTRAVLQELDARLPRLQGKRLHSVYFGGGTPSLWEPQAIAAILEKARSFFGSHVSDPLEVTLEANPGAVERQALAEMKSAGINRVSMGVQALDDALLKRLGRIHNSQEALDALSEIQRLDFASHSIDFIYSVPGQSEREWRASLDRVVSLATPHVSAYTLIYEPGTLMHQWRETGAVKPVLDDAEASMFDSTSDVFGAAGYLHYEISNFAQPGHQSVHNSLYWRGQYYLGVGAGACSFLPGGERTESLRDPNAYIAAWSQRALRPQPFESEEQLTVQQRFDEHVLLGMRTSRGWDAKRSETELSLPALRVAREVSDAHPDWCTFDGAYLRPTRTGYLMNDSLIMAVVNRGGLFSQ